MKQTHEQGEPATVRVPDICVCVRIDSSGELRTHVVPWRPIFDTLIVGRDESAEMRIAGLVRQLRVIADELGIGDVSDPEDLLESKIVARIQQLRGVR